MLLSNHLRYSKENLSVDSSKGKPTVPTGVFTLVSGVRLQCFHDLVLGTLKLNCKPIGTPNRWWASLALRAWMQVCEPVNFLVSPWFWYRRCHQANSPVFVFVCFSYHVSLSSSFCGCSHLLLCLSVALVALVAFVVIVVACYACAVAVAATVVAVLLIIILLLLPMLLLLLVGLAFLLLFLQFTEAGLYATICTAGQVYLNDFCGKSLWRLWSGERCNNPLKFERQHGKRRWPLWLVHIVYQKNHTNL